MLRVDAVSRAPARAMKAVRAHSIVTLTLAAVGAGAVKTAAEKALSVMRSAAVAPVARETRAVRKAIAIHSPVDVAPSVSVRGTLAAQQESAVMEAAVFWAVQTMRKNSQVMMYERGHRRSVGRRSAPRGPAGPSARCFAKVIEIGASSLFLKGHALSFV